jgi:hypothetical protein
MQQIAFYRNLGLRSGSEIDHREVSLGRRLSFVRSKSWGAELRDAQRGPERNSLGQHIKSALTPLAPRLRFLRILIGSGHTLLQFGGELCDSFRAPLINKLNQVIEYIIGIEQVALCDVSRKVAMATHVAKDL